MITPFNYKSTVMYRLNIYFACNRRWKIRMACNSIEVYYVTRCIGPCFASYLCYCTRPRYGNGCVWMSNIVSKTVGSAWVSNLHKFNFLRTGDPFTSYHVELYWSERTLSFKLESVSVFYFIIHWEIQKKSLVSSLFIPMQCIAYCLLFLYFFVVVVVLIRKLDWRINGIIRSNQYMQCLLGFHMILLQLEDLFNIPGCFPGK